MKFIFVRHGQTLFNQLGLTQGWCDSPLTYQGIKQVEQLEGKLRNKKIDAIYSSPLGRAYQTASILNCHRQLKINRDERLKEIFFGCFEGSSEYLRDHFQVESSTWMDDLKMDYKAYEGENLYEVVGRHYDFLKDVIKKHNENQTILVVGHGCSLHAFIKNMKQDLDLLFFPNAGAVVLDIQDHKINVIDMIH